jgi:broad specificity phosphatase PhoE
MWMHGTLLLLTIKVAFSFPINRMLIRKLFIKKRHLWNTRMPSLESSSTAASATSKFYESVTNELETRFITTSTKNPTIWKDKADQASVQLSPYSSDRDIFTSVKSTNNTSDHKRKLLHIIRHAQGTHNVNRQYRDIQHMDAQLTELGKQQCRDLANRIEKGETAHLQTLVDASRNGEAILIVTSPMTRCIQTTLLSLNPIIQQALEFENPNISIIVHDDIRETVNYECDHRRNISDIKNEIQEQFPTISSLMDFTSNVQTEDDDIWGKYITKCGDAQTQWIQHRESAEIQVVAERGRRFFNWLKNRPEKVVVICSHAAFLRCITNFALDDTGVPMLPKQLLNPTYPTCSIDWIPVIQYSCPDDDATFESSMRKDFQNCEIRTVIASFPK